MREEYIQLAILRMTQQKEEVMRIAIGNVLGDFAILDVAKRCQWTRRLEDTFEILYLDGHPILELHDMETPTQGVKEDHYVLEFTQNYRLLGRAATNTVVTPDA